MQHADVPKLKPDVRGCVFLLVLLAGMLAGCGAPTQPPATSAEGYLRFGGETMGTTYHVQLSGVAPQQREELQLAVDSLLLSINAGVNHYDPTSLLSQFNQGDTLLFPVLEDGPERLEKSAAAHFSRNLQLTQAPLRISAGAFDPTVSPLVEYYGFGPTATYDEPVRQEVLDSLLALVGMDKLGLDTTAEATYSAYAKTAGARLDFSAVAKGYAVDQVFLLLQALGGKDVYVDIGGETRAAGQSPRGTPWSIGVNTPRPEAALNDLVLALKLSGAAVATSGNYRNVRVRGGKRYVHTINPHTGRAQESSILSASVVAEQCAIADAYATACMVSGERAPEVLAKAGLSGCLIFATADSLGFDIRYVGDFEDRVLPPRQ